MPTSVDVSTPSDREITVRRVFDAPAQLIFDFHTKPELVKKWLWGPAGWSMPVCEIDLVPGGTYRYVWRNDDNGHEFGTHGTFREITAPARIVHTDNMDGAPSEALCTVTFDEKDSRTTLTTNILFVSKDVRDQALEIGMTDGMSASYDRLAGVIGSRDGGVAS